MSGYTTIPQSTMRVLLQRLWKAEAQVQAVRELCDLTPTVIQEAGAGEIVALVEVPELLAILDGGDA